MLVFCDRPVQVWCARRDLNYWMGFHYNFFDAETKDFVYNQ